jgi:hypothetical protein
MLGLAMLLAALQTAPVPGRDIVVAYECSHRVHSDERTCRLELTVSAAESGGRESVIRYECLIRRNVRCVPRSRPPRDVWARRYAEGFARRFEADQTLHSLRDGQAYQLRFRVAEDSETPLEGASPSADD